MKKPAFGKRSPSVRANTNRHLLTAACAASSFKGPGSQLPSAVPVLRLLQVGAWLPLLVLVATLGCAPTVLTSRTVQQDAESLVRLDRERDRGPSEGRYQHPVSWETADLTDILSRLMLQDRAGLMDSPRPPKPVFLPPDLVRLVPPIVAAFKEARPQEWVAFYLAEPSPTGVSITSGGLFMESGQLHVVLANIRTDLPARSEEEEQVTRNPLFSIRGTGGELGFESPQFIVGRRANWSGGHKASASELILDTAGYRAIGQLRSRSTASEKPQAEGALRPPTPDLPTTKLLQQEIERLKSRIVQLEADVDMLKRQLPAGAPSTPRR